MSADVEPFEVPVDEPGPEEVLIRVLSVGLCGSDAHWFEEGGIGDATLPDGGVIPGHEFCGVIESGPRTGERVAVDPAIPCLRCEQCADGPVPPMPRHAIRRARGHQRGNAKSPRVAGTMPGDAPGRAPGRARCAARATGGGPPRHRLGDGPSRRPHRGHRVRSGGPAVGRGAGGQRRHGDPGR